MRKIAFLTTEDARFGFSLAGMHQTVGSPEEAEKVLSAEMADRHTGLIIMDERLMSGIPMKGSGNSRRAGTGSSSCSRHPRSFLRRWRTTQSGSFEGQLAIT